MNRLGRGLTSEINNFHSFERVFENKALSGLNIKHVIRDVKNITRHNKLTIDRINVAKQIKDWLKNDYKIITNKRGDKIFMSKDRTKKVRFDIKNSHGDKPHVHFEKTVNGEWVDATNKHRIYLKD